MDKRIHLLPFSFVEIESKYPYYIRGMNPHIKNVVQEHEINLIIVSEIGHSIYPILTITDTPVIMINNFGSPTTQRNIVHVNYVSTTVRDKALAWLGRQTYTVLNTPTTDPLSREEVENLRTRLGFTDTDFVFGRTGRNSDAIFDPIGLDAFKRVVKDFPEAKMLVMAPPPLLKKKVKDEHIPNVFFLDPTTQEADIWAFHHSLDALTHYRYDGETLGLNIAEAMRVGKPVISHVSRIWNAHVEYLDPSFSRVASLDNAEEYAEYMKEFIRLKKNSPATWEGMKLAAKEAGDRLFSRESYLIRFRKAVARALSEHPKRL